MACIQNRFCHMQSDGLELHPLLALALYFLNFLGRRSQNTKDLFLTCQNFIIDSYKMNKCSMRLHLWFFEILTKKKMNWKGKNTFLSSLNLFKFWAVSWSGSFLWTISDYIAFNFLFLGFSCMIDSSLPKLA